MKLKNRNKWALLVGIGMLPCVNLTLKAADIGVLSNGSQTVSNNQTGNRIIATGGTGGNGSNPLIVINPGGTLGPDGANSSILLNSANYSSTVYSGGIFGPVSGNNQPTINPSVALPITGIINDGTINGGGHAINANNNRMLLLNTGTILGGNTGTNAGIFQPGGNSLIMNTSTGVITGRASSAIRGEQGGADNVTVQNAGTIQSNALSAIVLDDNALIINSGRIAGATAGVFTGSNSRVYNLSGGIIEGIRGYETHSLTGTGTNTVMTLHNWGTITGTGGTAVVGSDGGDSFFINGGSIINGTIAGNDGNDVIQVVADSTGNATVNNGSLSGGDDADTISITANAYDALLEDFFNGVATINGDILGGAGTDTITLTSSDSGQINVTGLIDGGSGGDTISLTASLSSLINVSGNISGGTGTDSVSLQATTEGQITIGGSITAETITLTADGEDTSISVAGGLTGGTGVNPFTITASNAGTIVVGGLITLDDGADSLNVTATGENSNIALNGGISAGAGADTINLTATGTQARIDLIGAVNLGGADDVINLTAQEGGTITLNGSILDSAGSDSFTFVARDQGSILLNGSIDAGVGFTDSDSFGPTVGADIVTLNTQSNGFVDGAIVINGDILGGAGIDTLNIIGGLQQRLDFSGDESFADNVESMRGTGMNLVLGSVTGFQTLNKTGTGLALISGYDQIDSQFTAGASHQVDVINVTNGSFYLNGNLQKTPIASNTSERTQIYVGTNPGVPDDDGADDTFATEFGGTGAWSADVVMEHGGFSAGQIAINYDWNISDNQPIMLLALPVNTQPSIDSIGRVDITGSLFIGANSHIRYDLNPQINSNSAIRGDGADYITHATAGGGIVTFSPDSQIRLSPTDVNRVIGNGRYVVVSSDSQISGIPGSVSVQFNANVLDTGSHLGTLIPELNGVETANVRGTNLERFSTLRIVQNGTGVDSLGEDLVVDIQHNYAGIGRTINQSAIGAAIDGLVYSEDSNVQDFISALDYSDEATAVSTLESISPENQLGQTVGIMSANYRTHRLLENYLSSSRSASSDTVSQQVSRSGRLFPTSNSQNIRVWGTIANDWQKYEDDTNNTEYDGYTTAFTAGVDYRVNSSLVLGILAEGTNAEFDYSIGSQDMDSMRFAAYGTWGKATGFYVNFALGYGTHDMSDTRDVGGLWGVNRSDTDANSFTGLLTSGYTMSKGSLKHGPFAGLEYQNMDVDGFAVTGGLLPVNVNDYSVDSLRALIGYRAEATYGKFVPFASIAYAHEFKDEDVIVNASIAGSAFAITTDTIGSSILMTLGSGYQANEDLFFNVGYRGEVATESNGINSHGMMFGADFKF